MKDSDLLIKTFTNGPNVALKIIHLPTNLSVWGESRSPYQLKVKLKKELTELVRQNEIYVNGRW